MKICYVVNQYPKVSHSFIRREITALEAHGASVLRTSMRGWNEKLVDAADIQEQTRTRYVLQRGAAGLLRALLGEAIVSPRRFFRALRLAVQLSGGSGKRARYLIYLAEACQVARWSREAGCSHLHAHFGTNSADVVVLASVLAARPCSFTVHGPEEFDRPQTLHLTTKIDHSAAVIAVSSFGRSQLYRWARFARWSSVHVVRCGIDAGFAPSSQPPAGNVFSCVGRLCEQKGQLLLVRALALVVQAGHDARLVLAGDGEMRDDVEREIRVLGLQDKVRITGWIDGNGVRELICASRAMVLPSFAEGLPVAIMEALALERPVITTYIAGIPELVVDGGNGWLVPAGDEQRLADAMIACLATPASRLLEMGQQGRAAVLERHDSMKEAASLLRVFAG